MNTIRHLNDLIGEHVSAVCFVMDYVELRFNGPILRALTDIIVERGRGRHVFPAPGSRDALCELIEAKLERIEINENRAMTLHFDKARTVIIPLTTDDKTGPEAAHFVPGENQPIFVW